MENETFQLDRRSILAGLGGLMGALGAVSLGSDDAAAQSNAASSTLPGYLPKEAWDAAPGVIDGKPPFTLTDPMQNWYALMKTTNNLVGARTYVPMFMRVFFAPQGKAAFPLYTSFGMWTFQFQKPDPAKLPSTITDLQPNDVVQRALYTGIICDPFSFEPVEEIENPYIGKKVKVRDSVFAESWLLRAGGRGFEGIDRPGFREDNPERAKRGSPNVRFGDEISFHIAGILKTEGPLQPRVDGSFWTVKYDELMDPKKDLIKARYNFAGISRARERKWLGVGDTDDSQLLFNTQGLKVHSVDDIPDAIKNTVLKKYPDRV
jgi:hypothetical protein